jgi:hypothetical protein
MMWTCMQKFKIFQVPRSPSVPYCSLAPHTAPSTASRLPHRRAPLPDRRCHGEQILVSFPLTPPPKLGHRAAVVTWGSSPHTPPLVTTGFGWPPPPAAVKAPPLFWPQAERPCWLENLSRSSLESQVGLGCHTPFRERGNEASIRVPRMFKSHAWQQYD